MTTISEALAALVHILLGLFLATREKPTVRSLLIAALGAVAASAAVQFAANPLLGGAVCEVAGMMLCLHLSGRTDRRKNLFFCLMLELGLCIWHFIAGAGLAWLCGLSDLAVRSTPWGQLPLWIVNLGLAAAAVLIVRNEAMAPRAASLAAVGGIFGVALLSENAPEDMAFTYLLFSVILLTGIMVDRLGRQYETEKELAGLKQRQAELLERDYHVLNRAYAENAKTFHDMHNHIGAIRSLLAADKTDKAIAYLDALQKPVGGIASTLWTGDETVDYLINIRLAAAEKEGIRFDTQIEFPPNTSIGSADLCAVLGNLLDNAFEAVRREPADTNRSITLTIRRINRMLVIKVVNTFSGQLHVADGRLKTTKTDGGLHGWGVESARTAAEKYDGTITTTAENGVFTAVATLFF